ncbi:MAG TPA: prepilin-type N-terminal cleavage/methylation domain-containing protein [Pontiellaceae bacterium]|nr:prepilin-type N-terminal cleavage/methylation domain-containing protein [Pontiellaceae bacterium]HPR83276.1 prepilin-type N-terminal cleavage/methylation domain-containing protein [Pontiellaceae bacterium]
MKTKTGKSKASKGFTLVEILIVVAIIGLIAAIGIPSFINSRQNAETNMKAINVAAVNAAKDQWAIINNKATGTTVAWTNIAPYIGNSVSNQAGLTVGGSAITINPVGTSASY